MRILHTSDWHLGRSLHGAELYPAFELWCRHVIDLVREREIDAVLISGDVYDRGVPPAQMVSLFNSTLEELSMLTTVILTSGNHDSPLRLGFGAGLMKDSIHIRTDARHAGDPIVVKNKNGKPGALVYALPYLDPDVERRNLAPRGPDGEPQPEHYLERSHVAVLQAALDLVSESIAHGPYSDSKVARICMAHAFITGGAASPSERDIHVGGVDNSPSGLFRLGAHGEDPGPLSYVALGHLHSPQSIGLPCDPPMRYAGSPIAFSFSENRPKSSVLLEVEGNNITTELIPAPVWRAVTTLTGTLQELLEPRHQVHADDFTRLIVTDPARPTDMSAVLRRAFAHPLEIQHRTEAMTRSPRLTQLAAMNPLDVLKDFMIISGNRELEEDELLLLTQAWEKTLSEHEGEAR